MLAQQHKDLKSIIEQQLTELNADFNRVTDGLINTALKIPKIISLKRYLPPTVVGNNRGAGEEPDVVIVS